MNRILIQEYIKLGQRVQEFKVSAIINGRWKQLIDGTTIGHKVIRKFPVVKTSKIKVTISKSKACPVISNIELLQGTGRMTGRRETGKNKIEKMEAAVIRENWKIIMEDVNKPALVDNHIIVKVK